MNIPLLRAIAAVILATTPVLADDGLDGSFQDSDSHLGKYRFNEADLKRLEKVHLTPDTAIISAHDATAMEAPRSGPIAGAGPQADALIQWTDQDGKSWRVSVDSRHDARVMRIGEPWFEAGPVAGDDGQQFDEIEAIQVTSIPEPASLALLTIGLLLVCPRSSRTTPRPTDHAVKSSPDLRRV